MVILRTAAAAGLLALAALGSAQSVPTAAALMKDAQAQAAKEKKAVWVVFHASW